METKKHITFLVLLLHIICFISVVEAQNTQASEERLNQIIDQATLTIYKNPIEVIRIGDSLYNSSSKDINEKVTGLLLITDGYIAIRNYPKANEYLNEAKGISSQHINSNLKIKVLNRFAYQHFQLNLYEEALKYLNESEEQNEMDHGGWMYLSNKGYVNGVRGLIYRQLEGCDVAIRYFQRSIDDYEQSKDEVRKINLSIVNYNMGNCYISLGQYEKAKTYFQIAYNSADKYGGPQNSLKLFAKKGEANYYYVIGQYHNAIEILNTINDDAKKAGDKSLMRSISAELAANYLETDNWLLYEKNNEEYKKMNKELKNSEINATMFALDENKLNYQSMMQKNTITFYKKIGTILFVFVFLFLLILFFIVKKRGAINSIRLAIFKNKK